MQACLQLGVTPSVWRKLDPLDRGLILAHMDNESRICQMCGNYIDQEMVLGESVWKVHEHVCQGCNVIGVFDREPGKHTIKRDTAGRTTHAVLTPLAKQE